MNKIYYEVEEFDDGTYQIGCGEEAKENYDDEIKHKIKRKKFEEIR